MSGNPSPTRDQLTLVVNGKKLSGWTSTVVTRGIERMPNTFEIELTEKAPNAFFGVVNAGDSCQVMLGSDLVLTGYIDDVVCDFDSDSHTVRIVGRSKSEDFVDSSADIEGSCFINTPILRALQSLAKPHGVTVTGNVQGPIIDSYFWAIGERAFDIAERVARFGAVLLYDQPDGSIIVSDVGTRKAASGVTEGTNAQQAQTRFRTTDRFRTYNACAVSLDPLRDISNDGNLVTSATDPSVRATRVRWSIAEADDTADYETTKKTTLWDCARRAARGRTVKAVVDSWRDSAGKLWEPNTLVPVTLPSLKLNGEMLLLGEVIYRLDGNKGSTAELTLAPPDAYRPQPLNLQPQLRELG